MKKDVYDWENIIYPKYQKIFLKKKEQLDFLERLSLRFQVSPPQLVRNRKKKCLGWYTAPGYDDPPIIALLRPCTLGTLIHEFAHHLCWNKFCSLGHSQKFIRCLKEVYRVIDEL